MTNVEINKSIKLSEHMTLGEMTVTKVKTADKNIPSHVAIENLKRLCKWLEHLRTQYNLRYSDGSHPIICGGFCLDHLRRGLALGSGPDEKVASDFTSVPDPSARRCGGAQRRERPDPSGRRLRRGWSAGARLVGVIGLDLFLGEFLLVDGVPGVDDIGQYEGYEQ